MWKVFGLRKIFFDRILARSYWLWRKHPILMVPTMLGTGLATIEQVFPTMTIIAIANVLAGNGSLESVSSSILRGGYVSILTSPAGYLLAAVFFVVTVVGYALVGLVGGGFVYSAEYGSYLEAWEKDNVTFQSILETGARRWKAMAATILLTFLITWSPVILVGLVTLAIYFGTGNLFATVISLLFFYELAIFASLLLNMFTIYAYPAVVVDNVSGMKAVRNSFRVAGRNLGATATYGIVRGSFQILLTLIALQAARFQLQLPLASLTTTVISLLLIPILHSTKTMIFYYSRAESAEMPFNPSGLIVRDLYRKLPRAAWSKFVKGLREIGSFLSDPGNLIYHATAIMALGIGIIDGNYITNSGLGAAIRSVPGYNPYQGNPNVVFPKVVPPALGIDIFFHNWLVSIGTALAGIGFGFPSFADILFNGFVIGIIQPLTPTNAMFLSAILPHGIIEIPSLVLAGSVGIKLGVSVWRSKLGAGPETDGILSRTLRQAVYVVVGLALLFLIAGLIEADITPLIMKLYGWTF